VKVSLIGFGHLFYSNKLRKELEMNKLNTNVESAKYGYAGAEETRVFKRVLLLVTLMWLAWYIVGAPLLLWGYG